MHNPEMNYALSFALVESRHDTPAANGAILSQSDVDKALGYLNKGKTTLFAHVLENAAFSRTFSVCKKYGWTWTDPEWDGDDMIPEFLPRKLTINLFVTGFTPALVAVINMCKCNGITLNTWHYNKDNGDYFYYPIA